MTQLAVLETTYAWMQVAAKFTHRPERHQTSEKAPISVKIML